MREFVARGAVWIVVAVGTFGALAVTGCERVEPPPFDGPRVLGGVEISAEVLNRGRQTYMGTCRPCHGPLGDGQGPLGVHQRPPARDLRTGIIKYGSVPSGSLPRDEDLVRVIRRGVPGTAMLAWDVPEEEILPVVHFIKTFSPRWQKEVPAPPVEMSPDPWTGREEEAAAEGRVVFTTKARCPVCHDVSGAPAGAVQAQHLARQPLRGGDAPEDLYRVIAAGVGGGAMPAWKGVLAEEDIWALVHYVRSLRAPHARR